MSTTQAIDCKFTLLQLICTLKKLCNHPCLIEEDVEGVKDVNVSDSSKLLVTSSLITDQTKMGNKVVLVSNYTQVILGHFFNIFLCTHILTC